MASLDTELATFERELDRLLADPDNRDGFALVHGDTVAGVYPDFDAALAAGYATFGLEPFLVKQVTEHEAPLYFSRNLNHRCPS
jgi:hypothetical protein